jgi:hypothetical protein
MKPFLKDKYLINLKMAFAEIGFNEEIINKNESIKKPIY